MPGKPPKKSIKKKFFKAGPKSAADAAVTGNQESTGTSPEGNGEAEGHPMPEHFKGVAPKDTVVKTLGQTRILFISDISGALLQINALILKHRADIVVHTGLFGFFDGDSADSMKREVLAAAANASPVVNGENFHDYNEERLRELVGSQLSELPLFLAHAEKFIAPVYTIWGKSEDISVIEKFRDGTYNVPNLHLVDEHNAPLIPETSVRLVGLPGLFEPTLFFNIAEGTTVPGTAGSTWASIWQIGELLNTYAATYNIKETRIFLSTESPVTNPLLNYLALNLRATFTVSASDSSYTSSFGDTSIFTYESFDKQAAYRKKFLYDAWKRAKDKVFAATADNIEKRDLIVSSVDFLLEKPHNKEALEATLNNKWNLNLASVAQSKAVMTISEDQMNITIINKPFVRQGAEDTERSKTSASDAGAPSTFATLDTSASSTITASERLKKNDELDPSNGDSEKGTQGTHIPEGPRNPERSLGMSPNDAKAQLRAEKKELQKQKQKEKRKLKDKEAKRLRAEEAKLAKRPGLWFKNGDRSPDEILGFLADEDRSANPEVQIKSNVKPNGLKSKVALVFFDTAEQAAGAYERVDKDAAGTVSIYQPDQRRPQKGAPKKRDA